MNTEFIRTFALLFGAAIALICAIYVALIARKKRIAATLVEEQLEQDIN
ncbi:unnamed protein product [marine sediment metagenome]|uniref:Uncharacterized protein n=1 Tax=marine sediment metagenome TaxID=412755 RepID=X0UJM0_9ZZZZ